MVEQEITVDVVVVGGGLAGMYAALAAQKQGCNVAILCKGIIGRSGSSVVAQTVHRVAYPNDRDMECYFKSLGESGQHLNKGELLSVLVSEGNSAIESVQSLGVEFEEGMETLPNGGHIRRFACVPRQGRLLTQPVRNKIFNTGIQFIEKSMVLDLLHDEGEVQGVVCLMGDNIFTVYAKAVILATGGAGRIYRETSNPIGITGDGLMMGVRAGLKLTDMEFIQFYPYRIQSPKLLDLNPGVFDHGAIFTNENGERFMRNFPRAEQENRDILARQMFKQKAVYLKLSDMSQKDLQKYPALNNLIEKGFGNQLKMQVVAHFAMGGIVANSVGQTELQGLFACGECSGGLHGANRLAGAALTECAVFGPRAGRAAAEYARCKTLIKKIKPSMDLPATGMDRLKDHRADLRKIMWEYAGIERSETMLKTCIIKLDSLAEVLKHMRPKSLWDWSEVNNMLQISLIIAETALSRRESRGSHFRSDFQDRYLHRED